MKITKYVVKNTDKRGEENFHKPMTVPELIQYFGYTLEVGHSYNNKIQLRPKTIKSFVSHFNLAVDEKYGGYYRPYLTLVGSITGTAVPEFAK